MIISWLFIAANVWLAIMYPGSKIAFMARKEGKTDAEGSAELVARAAFILQHLPPVLPKTLFVPGDEETSHCYLRLPNGSEILGLGQGGRCAGGHMCGPAAAREADARQSASGAS